MAWDQIPGEGVDLSSYDFLKQFPRALAEKTVAAGGGFYPVPNQVQAPRCGPGPQPTGWIGEITETLLTDDERGSSECPPNDWSHLPSIHCGGNRWYDLDCHTVAPWNPRFYDVIIQPQRCEPGIDERHCYRAQITGNTSTELQLAPGLSDYVTAGFLDSIDSLVEAPYFIIGSGRLWWTDAQNALSRFPDFPNDPELFRANVASVTVSTGDSTSDSSSNVPGVTVNFHCIRNFDEDSEDSNSVVGADLLFYASEDSRLKRVTVSAAHAQSISYDDPTFTPRVGDPIIILDAGGKGMPGRQSYAPFRWYYAATDQYYFHSPDDNGMGAVYMPATELCWLTGTPVTTGAPCTEVCHDNIFDNLDVFTDVEEECGAPSMSDFCFSPYAHKTIRGWQIDAENLAPSFIAPQSYEAFAGVASDGTIPNFTPATWFNSFSCNSGTSSVSERLSSTGDYFASGVDSAYEGVSVVWTILNADGSERLSGESVVSSGDIDLGAGLWGEADFDNDSDGSGHLDHPSDVGKTVVYSAKWTRKWERQFRFMSPKSVWIPDTSEDTGAVDGAHVVKFSGSDSTGCFGVGTWYRRSASTEYKSRTSEGYAVDGGGAFVEGEYARYVGTNFADPGASDSISLAGSSPIATATAGLDADYWNRFYSGQLSRRHNYVYRNQLRGTVKSDPSVIVGANTLTDTDQNWFDLIWFGGSTTHIETGTADSGGSDHLFDDGLLTDDDGSGHNERACFWDPSRFVGFTGAYAGFVIEIDKSSSSSESSGDVVTYKTVVTSVDAETGRINFIAVDGLTVEAGDVYRIKEPYEHNRFEGRKLRVIQTIYAGDASSADSSSSQSSEETIVHVATITGNDATTLWFTWDDGGDDGLVIRDDWEYQIVDPEYGGVWQWDGSKWVFPEGICDNRTISPTIKHGYGRMMIDDLVSDLVWSQQLYAGLNKLRDTDKSVSWDNKGEVNYRSAGDGADVSPGAGDFPDDWPQRYQPAFYNVIKNGIDAGDDPDHDWVNDFRRGLGCTRFNGVTDSWACAYLSGEDPEDPCFFCGEKAIEDGAPFALAYTGETHPPQEDPPILDEDLFASLDLTGQYSYARLDNVPTCLSHSVDFYVWATIDSSNNDEFASPTDYATGYHFDAGPTGALYRQWHKWDSAGSTSADQIYSAMLGSTDHPPIADPPTLSDTGANGSFMYGGYYAFHAVGVMHWNMTYLD